MLGFSFWPMAICLLMVVFYSGFALVGASLNFGSVPSEKSEKPKFAVDLFF